MLWSVVAISPSISSLPCNLFFIYFILYFIFNFFFKCARVKVSACSLDGTSSSCAKSDGINHSFHFFYNLYCCSDTVYILKSQSIEDKACKLLSGSNRWSNGLKISKIEELVGAKFRPNSNYVSSYAGCRGPSSYMPPWALSYFIIFSFVFFLFNSPFQPR